MAKREVPEINAGSMADIAFLLLIFFLVTTTMDRDKAYIRNIPKKVDVPPPDVPIQKRDILAIRANSLNQLMVRDEMMDNPDDISERVKEFYTMNEGLSNEQTKAVAANPNHPGNNFPLYTNISMAFIREKVDEAYSVYEEEESKDQPDDDMLEFLQSGIDEWEKKKSSLNLFGQKRLPEISSRAHIRIEVQQRTGYELFAKIQSEIEEAIFDLRDEASKRIFNEGYGTVIAQLASDPSNKEYQRKLDLLKLLYPDRIIEVTPKG